MITRSYIEYLQYINRKTPKSWMSGYVDLPENVDLPTYEEWQERWVVRDCPDGVLGRLWRWVRS
jgi:hypothetical protein